MKNSQNSDVSRNQNAVPGSDLPELVCSPEFSEGCADTMDDLRPTPAINEAQNSEEADEPGFPEGACSAEFPEGCMDPLNDGETPAP